jgi:hypothetical protein
MREGAGVDTRATGREGRLCSVVSKGAGDDPAGSAGAFDSFLAIEGPPPWKRAVIESACYPEGLDEIIEGPQETGVIDKFTGLVPDPEYSREGHARVLYWRRPHPGPFAAYEKLEYLVPDDEVIPFAEALREPDGLSRFEAYRQDAPGVRDVLVCTHGARDVCCGKFGYPIYNVLRSRHAAPGSLRIWRTSHVGGHRFAPTIVELPEGRYWGHLEIGAVEDLVERRRSPSRLGRFYRGWAGLKSNLEQIAEREIFTREGWEWTGYRKEGRVLAVDEDEIRASLRIAYEDPDGVAGAYEATVEASGSVMTLASSGTDPLEEVTQYRVTRLEKVS